MIEKGNPADSDRLLPMLEHISGPLHCPFIVLFEQDGPTRRAITSSLGTIPTRCAA